ncbi:MAG: O-antigen ligase family protein [Propionibacteriaceae bacterium]|nr:O-antigen ligase family protein [Propionibacteriaceae bacterium]
MLILGQSIETFTAAARVPDDYWWAFGIVCGLGLVWIVVSIVRLVRRRDDKLLPAGLVWLMMVESLDAAANPMSWLQMWSAGLGLPLDVVCGVFSGVEALLWVGGALCVLLFIRNWHRFPPVVLALVALWLCVLFATLGDSLLMTAVLSCLFVVALGLSPLRRESLALQLTWTLRVLQVASLVVGVLYPAIGLWAGNPGLFGVDRLRGVTIHANYLGLVCALSIVLELTRFKLRSLSLLWLAVGVFCLMWSSSRGSQLALLVALVFLACWSKPMGRLRWGWLRWALPTVTAAAVCVVSALIAVTPYEEMDAITSDRLQVWSAVWPHLWDYPWLGRGQLPNPMTDPVIAQFLPYPVAHCHNQWLQSTLESGGLGLAALVAVFACCVWAIVRSGKHRRLALALFAVVAVTSLEEVYLSLSLRGTAYALVVAVVIIGTPTVAPKRLVEA